MLQIDEQALKLLLTTRSVGHVELRESANGFGVFVRMGGSEQAVMLMSARKTPRRWASVDKFLKFLRAITPTPPEIRILMEDTARGKSAKTDAKAKPVTR